MHAALLPPELHDQVIDHLWNEPKSLAACAQTCRSWVGTSRLHLFRTVRTQNARQCTSFAALLASTPVIARCVRRLTISADYNGVDAAGSPIEDDAWVNEAGAFVRLLVNATTLGLSRLRWHALRPDTQKTFMEYFARVRTLFLFEVRFAASRDVLNFLGAFPSLNELYFHGVAWDAETPPLLDAPTAETAVPTEHKARECMQLSYLFLDPRSSPTLVTEWLLRHPSEQHLRTIQLCWREVENMKLVGDLLHASGAALERLLVEFPSGVPESGVASVVSGVLDSKLMFDMSCSCAEQLDSIPVCRGVVSF